MPTDAEIKNFEAAKAQAKYVDEKLLEFGNRMEKLYTTVSSQQNTIVALQAQVGALIARTAGHGATEVS